MQVILDCLQVLMGAACTDKADIFSYGVMLWEIVTGQQPKRGQLRECRYAAYSSSFPHLCSCHCPMHV